MPKMQERQTGLRIHEFAKKTGVTVRTRHASRVFRDADSARLDEISVLKFLGLSLTDIKAALASDSRRAELLAIQRFSIGHRRQLLGVAADMLEQLQRGSHDWTDLAAFVRDVG